MAAEGTVTESFRSLFRPWDGRGRLFLAVGNLRVWAAFSAGDLLLAREMSSDSAFERSLEEAEPEGVLWSRFSLKEGMERVLLEPVLPERPILVRTRTPIVVPPDTAGVFYVSVPLSVRISAAAASSASSAAVRLVCWLTQGLSDSWYGDPMMGEYCYSLKSRARRQLEDGGLHMGDAQCKVLFENQTPESFTVDKFCIHTDSLGLFASEKTYWTSTLVLTRREREDDLLFKSTPGTPPEAGDTEAVAPPRKAEGQGRLKLPFASSWLR